MAEATIIVHGGCGKYPEDLRIPREQGVKLAALEAWRILAVGGSAVDAVETAVAVLESGAGRMPRTGAAPPPAPATANPSSA